MNTYTIVYTGNDSKFNGKEYEAFAQSESIALFLFYNEKVCGLFKSTNGKYYDEYGNHVLHGDNWIEHDGGKFMAHITRRKLTTIESIKNLIGKTLIAIEKSENKLIFTVDNGTQYKMYHEKDCCESVIIQDINGDLEDLIGTPILMAEQVSSNNHFSKKVLSRTWTFYNIATIKGYVTIRWFGTSNGYYSEEVDFVKLK